MSPTAQRVSFHDLAGYLISHDLHDIRAKPAPARATSYSQKSAAILHIQSQRAYGRGPARIGQAFRGNRQFGSAGWTDSPYSESAGQYFADNKRGI
jgi:hypothetical protein